MNRLSIANQVRAVLALAEGCSVPATVRMTGVAKNTIVKLLAGLVAKRAEYHGTHVRALTSGRVTPAMEAGLTDNVWEPEELVALLNV